jgi:GNAT superfamily N-acetyltransferase
LDGQHRCWPSSFFVPINQDSLDVKITFRNLTPEDEEFEIALFDLAKFAPMGVPQEARRLVSESQVRLQRASYRSEYPDAKWKIVRADGEDCGRYIYCERAADVVGVDVAILPQFMNQGIGTYIVYHLQGLARSRNLPASISVEKYNSRAKALYLRLGFVEVESPFETHDRLVWREKASGD